MTKFTNKQHFKNEFSINIFKSQLEGMQVLDIKNWPWQHCLIKTLRLQVQSVSLILASKIYYLSYGGSILDSSQFTLLLWMPPKTSLDLKVVKIDSKIIISASLIINCDTLSVKWKVRQFETIIFPDFLSRVSTESNFWIQIWTGRNLIVFFFFNATNCNKLMYTPF